VSVLGPEDHRRAIADADPQVRARLTSAGLPVPSVAVEIRDADGRKLPAGERGRIWVRGAQVAGEYLGKRPDTVGDGFFDTRDEGYFDSDGYLFVKGRADDTIIRGAENIAPAEIEEVLVQHQAVREAVVVGLPDEEWGETIAAVVVPQPGAELDPDDVREFVRGVVRSSRTPEQVHVWSAIPHTETGKVVRREVVALLLARSTSHRAR
jgi:acyl-CoA synthetase (AMP-forming)/AMP-acid ligase II